MDPLGALIECCYRHSPEVDEDALREARLSVMTLDRDLRLAGFDGVHNLLRHDPSRSLRGVARFGPVGERREWPRPETGAFSEDLLREAAERFGIRYRAASTSAAARSPDSTAPSM